MSIPGIQQRCWNHEIREAVCRCPGCARSFCRECVTEHETRLLCAVCLRRTAEGESSRRRGGLRRMEALVFAVAGVALAWILFFGAGEVMLGLLTRLEQSSWQKP